MKHLQQRLGHVSVTPEGPVVAGSVGEWTITYTVGSYGIDEGGTIKFGQRYASDWEIPQFDAPSEPGYTTVRTSGQAQLAVRYDRKSHERPFMKCMVIDVYDGCLEPGDTVTIVLGDRSQGSPGSRAQTFLESAHEFRFFVDPTNAIVARQVPECPVFPIVAGEAERVVCIVPTNALVGEAVSVFVRGRDRWDNPTSVPEDASLLWEGSAEATIDGRTLTVHEPGGGYVLVHCDGQVCRSNPINVTPEESQAKRYWGDLHAQSDATVGTGDEVEYFTFGRDEARLDFTSHQGNDFQVTDEIWQRLNDVVDEFHEEGQFVVFPGYEWSANTRAGGDRNVFYLETGLPIIRSSHWQIPDTPEDALTPAHPADVFFERVRENVDLDKVLLGSHVGGRYADIRRYFDQELGPLVEVVSCWGVFEWMLWDSFDAGYIVGVMCNSDGHKGRPGDEGPGAGTFGIRNGLTCVLAGTLTRKAVFEAIKQRRCYGTSGPRIDLAFEVDGRPMGTCMAATDSVRVTASVRGTAPLDALVLYQGKEILQTARPDEFAECGSSSRIRVAWGGARIRGRGRRATWDGTISTTDAQIEDARTFAFDSPADGILDRDARNIRFQSRTTGDLDGIDLWLDRADAGRLVFASQTGDCEVDLTTLGDQPVTTSFGGLDLHVTIERYPEALTTWSLTLETTVPASPGERTPLFVKAIQSDGHAAWASPVYVEWE